LPAVHTVVSGEEQPAPDIGEAEGTVAANPRGDVLDQDRARPGAVGPPQLSSMHPIVGGEEHPAPDLGEVERTVAARTPLASNPRADVLDQDRARTGAI